MGLEGDGSRGSLPMMKQLYQPRKDAMRVAALMSGRGSNVRKILEQQQKLASEGEDLFRVVMIFTDTADEEVCKARAIAEEHKLPYYYNDIGEYYRKQGHDDRKDMNVREKYDSETAKLLKLHRIDVVALCGYMSIITKPVIGEFLTLNVHPADLRIKDSDGGRKYAGCMGAGCVKKAIMNDESEVRSTTHIVTENVDAGQILLVSKPVKLDSPEIKGRLADEAAHHYLEKLKQEGDRKIYPETLRMLAEGRFAADESGTIYLDGRAILNGWEMK